MFFFAGGMEKGAGRVLKEATGRCLHYGGTTDLVETEKVLKLFFIPAWWWLGKDPAHLCRKCGLLALGSLGGEPGPFLPRDASCGTCSRAVNPQFWFCPICSSVL